MTMPESNLEKLFEKYKSAYPAIEHFMQEMYQTDSDPLELAIFLNVLCGYQINRAMLEQGLSEENIPVIEQDYVEEFTAMQRERKMPLMTQIIGLHKVLGISLLTMEQIRKMIEEGAKTNGRQSSKPSTGITEGGIGDGSQGTDTLE